MSGKMKHLKLEQVDDWNDRRCWKVFNKHEKVKGSDKVGFLGYIGWYRPWKKFAFYPEPKIIFEEVCMRDLALFIEDETKKEKTNERQTQSVSSTRGDEK